MFIQTCLRKPEYLSIVFLHGVEKLCMNDHVICHKHNKSIIYNKNDKLLKFDESLLMIFSFIIGKCERRIR